MAGKPSRGIFQIIFKHFIDSLKPRRFTGELVGKDHLGNKYFETPLPSSSYKKKPARYFEPQNKDDFQQEIPAEWEAWLRYRRKEPPAESEVLRNVAIIDMKKKNAAQLEDALHTTKSKHNVLPSLSETKGFPVYKDYADATSGDSKNKKD